MPPNLQMMAVLPLPQKAIKKQGQLIISYTGCGIKNEFIKKIFEVFKQVDSSISRNTSGSGLGLAISKKLIELQDGNISVKSKYGVGSDFSITIPVL